MFANSMSANLTLASARSDGPSASEGKIAKVVHKLLMDHSIDRTFYLQDDLREVGLTSLDMASLVLSVEAEFDLMIPERDITPANFLSTPGLWIGLVFAAIFLVAAVRMRRYRDPL